LARNADGNEGPGLVGRCGLFCGSCDIYAVSHVPALDERRQRMAACFKRPPADVACEGCQNVTPQCWGNDCKILKCLGGRDLAYCDECTDMAECKLYADLDGRYKGITRRNLTRRRELGDAAWLAEQRTERACSRCGRPLIYGDDECAYCGATRTA
jgi:hypothetical protein